MALKKLSRSYGTQYAGLTAVLTETQTNMPVTVYVSPQEGSQARLALQQTRDILSGGITQVDIMTDNSLRVVSGGQSFFV